MSDRKIAKACGVSNHLVADIGASPTWNSPSETGASRTYTTKHGTNLTMRTAKVGKAKTDVAPTPANSGNWHLPRS